MDWLFPIERKEIWDVISAFAIVISSLVVIITAYFAYKQIRVHGRQNKYVAVKDMVVFMKSFSQLRTSAFKKSDIDIVVSSDQFPTKPPRGEKKGTKSEGEYRKCLLREEQTIAYSNCSEELIEMYRNIVNNLNDIGVLVEEGFIPKSTFYGMYHISILRCIYLVETYRRTMELERGGNYGQRLLRLRHDAILYHKIIPKHRDVTISIACGDKTKEILSVNSNWFQQNIIFPIIRKFKFPNK
jgi:hypothetical protein